MAERLRDATSPYLLQHADNPVDWWPWSEGAFAEARRRDVPVLLSVGYSACHWCHVMAHESFEDAAIAELMNSRLVSIKVDREERPDVDAVYMTATQAMTGQGGWPMTVFLTHDREPFYCGTYYPPGHFARLVEAISRAWQDHRGEVASQARQIAGALAESESRVSVAAGSAIADPAGLADAAVAALARRYDQVRGGFGGAPKFPPSTVLEFLLRRAERPADRTAGESAASESVVGESAVGESAAEPRLEPVAGNALRMAAGTLEAMARGGIYDQLGGGFARYSVDPDWVVPHFEKMLYDNAQLAGIYAHWWRRCGGDGRPAGNLARRISQQTCDWMLADLRTAEGGFASALDADSDGVEGAFYVWTPQELTEVLGEQDGRYAAELFGVSAAGTFEHGRSVLRLQADPADPARYENVRSRLLAARNARVWPSRDDKVVAAWNGLAIGSLADAGLLFGREDYVAAAVAAARLIAEVHVSDGRLARTSRDGIAGQSTGVLDDYACLAAGFVKLSGVTGDASWLSLAGGLLDVAIERFRAKDGGFYDTADDSERLIYRPADPTDGPTPAGTFALAGALLSYAALTGSAEHRQAAASALGPVETIAPKYPQAAGWGLAVAEAFIAGPVEIAIVGPSDDERTKSLHAAAAFGATAGAVIALGDGSAAESARLGAGPAEGSGGLGAGPAEGSGGLGAGPETGDGIPLLAGRHLVDGQPAAFVCRDFTCQLPVTSPSELLAALRS